MLTCLPEIPGQVFFRKSQYVASSFRAAASPPAAEEPAADEPAADEPAADEPAADEPVAEAESDDPTAPDEDAGAEAEAEAVSDDDAAAFEELGVLVVAVVLLPHAVMTNAIAPIPAMVAIALLADVRDTRPPPFLWTLVVRVLTTAVMKAFSYRLRKPERVTCP